MLLKDITPDWLREVWLWKIPLEYDNDRLSDEALQFYIDSAISRAEILLNIDIKKKTYEYETYDYRLEEWMCGYGYITLNHRPAIEVTHMSLNVITSEITIPPEWIQLKKKAAQVNLIPYYGILASANIANNLLLFMPLMQSTTYVPQILRVSYSAGYCDTDCIPDLLGYLIGMNATIGVLNVLGEIALGGQAGLAGYSIGIDGLSQSVSTTASAENAAYSGRIRQMEREMEEVVKSLRQYFYGLTLTAV
jgi:hypothetical protein